LKFTLGFTLREVRLTLNAAKGLGLQSICDWNNDDFFTL
jgi:hypothetical protein